MADTPEDQIRAAIAEAKAEIEAQRKAITEAITAKRDERIRAIVTEHGLRQVDLIRITEWSREAARQVLDPEAKAKARKATADRRARAQGGDRG